LPLVSALAADAADMDAAAIVFYTSAIITAAIFAAISTSIRRQSDDFRAGCRRFSSPPFGCRFRWLLRRRHFIELPARFSQDTPLSFASHMPTPLLMSDTAAAADV